MTLPAVLRQARRSRRWPMHRLARLVGVTKETVYSWESGRRSPSLDCFLKLCAVLDLDPRQFVPASPAFPETELA